MTKVISARIPDELHDHIKSRCEKLGCTPNDFLKKCVADTTAKNKPINLDQVFEHIKNCNRCDKDIIDKGYVLVSLEELKKHNLVPTRNPV